MGKSLRKNSLPRLNQVSEAKEKKGGVMSAVAQDALSSVTNSVLQPVFSPSDQGFFILNLGDQVTELTGFLRKHPGIKLGRGLPKDLQAFIDSARAGGDTRFNWKGHSFVIANPKLTGAQTIVFALEGRGRGATELEVDLAKRTAEVLKRMGRTLSSHQNLKPLCQGAAHELGSVCNLAAVMIWIHDDETDRLTLMGNVGVNRAGLSMLTNLSSDSAPGSIAELAAFTRHPIHLNSAFDSIFSEALETQITYLKPGGLAVLPLMLGNKLFGVLEIIGMYGDESFALMKDLFESVGEHIALAMKSSKMFEDFERLASHDALTGLANHKHLHEVLDARVQESERMDQTVGVLMIDVDHFRAFNEEEGHDAGDDVLRLVANVLKECLRPYDLAARYGGEEFTVVMPGSNAKGALAVAERMRSEIEAMHYFTRNGVRRRITASFGVAVYPENAEDGASLLKAADVALYEAKHHGRNRAVLFNGEMKGKTQELENQLTDALKFLNHAEQSESQDRLKRLLIATDKVAEQFKLTTPQVRILETLIQILPKIESNGFDAEYLEKLAKQDGFRVLMPHIEQFNCRYDEKGESIPLLARIAKALLLLDSNRLEGIEPGTLDPEIEACLTSRAKAA